MNYIVPEGGEVGWLYAWRSRPRLARGYLFASGARLLFFLSMNLWWAFVLLPVRKRACAREGHVVPNASRVHPFCKRCQQWLRAIP